MKKFNFLVLVLLNTACQEAKFSGAAPVAPGVCRSGEIFRGANFIFSIDNSGSMVDTDCPRQDPLDCGLTQRERALTKAFDVLLEASQASEFNEDSISSISIGKFTPETRFLSLEQIENPIAETFRSLPEERARFIEVLKFNRRPKGDTPYLNALRLGEQFMNRGQLLSNKRNILVLVTDGEPTDRRPSQVLNLARQLDARKMTIRVNHFNRSPVERRQEHLRVIQSEYPDWALDPFPSTEAYVDELMSLASRISDDAVIEISSVNQLESRIFENIIKQNVPCLPQNE